MANLGKFVNKIETFLNDIAHLEITTAVGEFNVKYDAASRKWVPVETPSGINAIRTDINLFQGDIVTAMHNRFSGDTDASIRDFHETQVTKAQDIVEGNISAFKEMVTLLSQATAQNDSGGGDGSTE